MYVLKYSNFRKQWLVINLFNGIAQSGWTKRADAEKAKRDLNIVMKEPTKSTS